MAKIELTGLIPAAVPPPTPAAASRMLGVVGGVTVRPALVPIDDVGRERVRQALGGAGFRTLAAV